MFLLNCIEGNGTALQYSCMENPMDGGAWWAAVHGVAKSQTWLSDFTFNFHFHVLEKEMATHSSVLDWRILGTGEPDGLPSMGSHTVGHDWRDLAAAGKDILSELSHFYFLAVRTERMQSWGSWCQMRNASVVIFYSVNMSIDAFVHQPLSSLSSSLGKWWNQTGGWGGKTGGVINLFSLFLCSAVAEYQPSCISRS